MAKKKAAKITGDAVADMVEMGQVPAPPPGAFDGLPAAPVMVRRNGRLVPLAETPPGTGAAPAHAPRNAPLPGGYPMGLDGAGFGHFETASKRAYNPTFHEPPQQVQQARGMAQSLRMILGQTVTQMELAYHEAQRVLVFVKRQPAMQAEIEREGLDLAQVKAFADEVDDVLRVFVPPTEG